MISVSKTPAAPPGTTTPLATGTPETPDAPFDAILSLESLAATSVALEAGATDGTLEALDDSPAGDRDDGDIDETDGDAEGPLAFLVSLLNMATVPAQPAPAAHTDAALDAAITDALSGQGGHAAAGDASANAHASTAAHADAGANAGPMTPALQAADARLVTQVLAQDASAQNGKPADATQSTDSSAASLARAVEMLSQAPRHALPVRDTIPTPTHSPRWADDFTARVAMLVRGGESTASLQLTPADMGPVDISVTVRDSQATIHFGASQADTRALLEASIPRLREMLAAQGFNLMDASVSQGFARQPRPDAPAPPRLEAVTEGEVQTTRVTAVGLLDTYA